MSTFSKSLCPQFLSSLLFSTHACARIFHRTDRHSTSLGHIAPVEQHSAGQEAKAIPKDSLGVQRLLYPAFLSDLRGHRGPLMQELWGPGGGGAGHGIGVGLARQQY